jgi:iron complex transport system substrate-binding protein
VRIASLLPSATEIVCAVGAREDLVGVSHECDHPPGVERLAVLTRPRAQLPRSSAAIDRAVQSVLRDALGVYEIDLERLRVARPSLIVTQDLCDVCAVSLDDVRRALAELAGGPAELVSCRPTRLAEVWEDVRRVGRAAGRARRADVVARQLEERAAAVGARTAALGERPSVLTVEWLEPVMLGGLWMSELVALAGGEALASAPGEPARTPTRAELEALDPDVVLIKPCGFPLARTAEELGLLRANLPWEAWRAVRSGRAFAADGSAYFNRPGPRLVESLEILAACLHPRACADLGLRHASAVRRVTPELELQAVGL